MKIFKDYLGSQIRLTEERRQHILLHPEMSDMIENIEDTLLMPDYVVQSLQDEEVTLYNKYYLTKKFGGKYLCVVVKENENDSFIITSFLINKIPKGKLIWQKN
ncbi:MAG: hypothetical protein HW421_2806 [Ignavibacteria bacterium]|nr:hypothetical protein [Ignavibacteria bacterium]